MVNQWSQKDKNKGDHREERLRGMVGGTGSKGKGENEQRQSAYSLHTLLGSVLASLSPFYR